MHLRFADAVFWIAVACCAVAQLAIIRSAFVSPATAARSENSDSTDSHAPASPARRATEIAWAILPGIALIVLFFYTWSAIHPDRITATLLRSPLWRMSQ
jgi:heme/copper-type cytochrome/quinol oxidase subunit 2